MFKYVFMEPNVCPSFIVALLFLFAERNKCLQTSFQFIVGNHLIVTFCQSYTLAKGYA